MKELRDKVAIVGIGESEITRGTQASGSELLCRAAKAACADAGIAPKMIDGLFVGNLASSCEEIASHLGIQELSYTSTLTVGGASFVSAITQATIALASGVCDTALIVDGWLGYSEMRLGNLSSKVLDQICAAMPSPWIRKQLEHPHEFFLPVQWYGLMAHRWLHTYGADLDSFGHVALTMREHAKNNPRALLRDTPLSMDAWQASRLIASPFRLLDCCIEADGASAIVLSRSNDVARFQTKPALVMGTATGRPQSPDDLIGRPDLMDTGLTHAAPRAFAMAGIGCEDVNFCQIYDCFTFILIRQLEELGFCARGEGGEFVKHGRLSQSGALPTNTHGGLLSQGHVLGGSHVIEAVRQLRDEAGIRQLNKAEIGLITGWGDLGDGAVTILRRP